MAMDGPQASGRSLQQTCSSCISCRERSMAPLGLLGFVMEHLAVQGSHRLRGQSDRLHRPSAAAARSVREPVRPDALTGARPLDRALAPHQYRDVVFEPLASGISARLIACPRPSGQLGLDTSRSWQRCVADIDMWIVLRGARLCVDAG
jgi:hypothetical protein